MDLGGGIDPLAGGTGRGLGGLGAGTPDSFGPGAPEVGGFKTVSGALLGGGDEGSRSDSSR